MATAQKTLLSVGLLFILIGLCIQQEWFTTLLIYTITKAVFVVTGSVLSNSTAQVLFDKIDGNITSSILIYSMYFALFLSTLYICGGDVTKQSFLESTIIASILTSLICFIWALFKLMDLYYQKP